MFSRPSPEDRTVVVVVTTVCDMFTVNKNTVNKCSGQVKPQQNHRGLEAVRRCFIAVKLHRKTRRLPVGMSE